MKIAVLALSVALILLGSLFSTEVASAQVSDSRSQLSGTGVMMQRGDTIEIAASGTVIWEPIIRPSWGVVAPNGAGYKASIIKTTPLNFPLLSAAAGALILRVGIPSALLAYR